MRRVVLLVVLGLLSSCGGEQDQYYGFYESEKGAAFKLFRHKIFGFEIDIPAEWVFGVVGTGPTSVIMIYSPDMNTGKFSRGYNTLTIGITPFPDVSLETTQILAIKGLSENYTDMKVISESEEVTVAGMDGLRFVYEWLSKTGMTVKENVSLIDGGQKNYSINIRTIDPVPDERLSAYEDAIGTLKIL